MTRVTVDRTALDALSRVISVADKKSLQVGWFDSAKYDDGTPVASIAAQNEFGNPAKGIPSRPFLRQSVESNRESWSSVVEQGALAVVNNNASINQVLNSVGLKVSADIKNSIVTGNFSPLSPITIALRKIKNDGQYNIDANLVRSVSAAIAAGETGSGQLGDQSFGNKDPLRDSGYMISTLTHELNNE